MNIGMFEPGEINTTVEFEWKQVATSELINEGTGIVTENGTNYVYTDTDLSALGTVTGNVTLNIEGSSTVAGSVYGGGEQSTVNGTGTSGNTIVTLRGNTQVTGNVFGGGDSGLVSGSTTVNIEE